MAIAKRAVAVLKYDYDNLDDVIDESGHQRIRRNTGYRSQG